MLGKIDLDQFDMDSKLCSLALGEATTVPVKDKKSAKAKTVKMLEKFNKRLIDGNALTENQRKSLYCACYNLGLLVESNS